MVITESSVSLASSHLSLESYQRKESLKAWVGDRRPDFEGETAGKTGTGDRVTLSKGQLEKAAGSAAHDKGAQASQGKESDDGTAGLETKYRLLKELIERWLHVKIKGVQAPETADQKGAAQPPTAGAQGQQPQRAGFGVEYDLSESSYQMESTAFSASGVIKTADGQEINFNLNVNMTREFASQTSVSVRAGDAVMKDPLVINFGGSAAELSSVRFSFDLDSDGSAEQVAGLSGNSAYLALDKNGNGTIDNGSELFGAKTGNGFGELSGYDTDHNGWIDENDAVYHDLKTWTGGADGAAGLTSLKEAGVGAIYLGSQHTAFQLKGADNASLGAVRSSGIFVAENGSVGSVQQVDLAV
ncbi:hypothetical protein [Geomesophilobacter sediminis]|uniref:VCBS repeat-containing protein n=1 Tax=Geomesophilobacter sediminis TaxID=2798584 RepID=A0A8J7JM42_9BACT|nr:hypothetical protein [Geomesophilobacter sediminis]MBJ6725495.1 hypothetical protein [Geomesophilobacter sediminis]